MCLSTPSSTCRWSMQLLDEIPMVWSSLAFIYCQVTYSLLSSQSLCCFCRYFH